MKLSQARIHLLIFLGLVLLVVLFASLSTDPFLLAFINISFLFGLFFLIIGCGMIVILGGTFDVLLKGFKMFGKAKLSEEERALMEFGREEDEDKESEEFKKQLHRRRWRSAFVLVLHGLGLMALSVSVMFGFYDL